MSVKHFIINPSKVPVSKESIAKGRERLESVKLSSEQNREVLNKQIIGGKENLKTVEGRVIVKIDMDSKESHQFESGLKISIKRRFDNFNNRETQPVNAHVVDAENIPAGAEVICHHNVTHESNRIYNYKTLSGNNEATDVRYFSIPVNECFAWHDGKQWRPLPGFDFALRVFKPYTGALIGIEPELIKNVLFIKSGEYSGKVCYMLRASDYELVFQDITGREGRLIRIRTKEDEKTKREMEIVAIDDDLTKKVQNGEFLVGLSKSDAKKVNNV